MPTTRSFPTLVMALIACLAFSSVLSAQQGKPNIIMVNVTNPNGISITSPSGRTTAAEKKAVPENAKVVTASGSSLMLLFSNGSSVLVKPNTNMDIAEYTQNGPTYNASRELGTSTTRLRLNSGDIIGSTKTLNINRGSSFQIETPVGIAGIRGTDWFAKVVEIASGVFETTLGVTEGMMSFDPSDNSGTIQLPGGQQVQITVTRDAQGVPQVSVSVPTTVPEETRDEINDAVAEINTKIEEARADFTGGGGGGGDGDARDLDTGTTDDVDPTLEGGVLSNR